MSPPTTASTKSVALTSDQLAIVHHAVRASLDIVETRLFAETKILMAGPYSLIGTPEELARAKRNKHVLEELGAEYASILRILDAAALS